MDGASEKLLRPLLPGLLSLAAWRAFGVLLVTWLVSLLMSPVQFSLLVVVLLLLVLLFLLLLVVVLLLFLLLVVVLLLLLSLFLLTFLLVWWIRMWCFL